ncbi:MAG TPA: XRE family transcriptional regulator [Mycobacteriales bacterium]|jgi:Zn-dependent peptidase ImmA (M78 family)/transcriptional regulator with XRE-family HTH domain|nr:XRE family transcriptional regulator [Mycobacteriales bacterium]
MTGPGDRPSPLRSVDGGRNVEGAAHSARLESVRLTFAPERLRLARLLARKRKNEVAVEVDVTPTAVGQWESGATAPSAETLFKLSLTLGVPVEFFARHRRQAVHDPAAAHFRSLRATSQAERSQALAFGELVWAVADSVSRWVELPDLDVPDIPISADASDAEVEAAATATRAALGLGDAPVGHVVRLIESRGVIAAVASSRLAERVDAFSHWYSSRPVIVLSSAKNDAARSRFDAAHELGHLVMHHDREPGSRIVERQAHLFASCFLAPPEQLVELLPRRADWGELAELKLRYGVSLKGLAYTASRLGVWGESTMRTAMVHYNRNNWNAGEPASLGEAERPSMLGRCAALLDEHGITLEEIAGEAGLPPEIVGEVLACASDAPRLRLN